MAKYIDIGNLMVKENDKGEKSVFLTLGKTNKDPKYSKYDLHVEIVVKDNEGKVVARQTDGFVGLVDPRTQPRELLAKELISKKMAEEMEERAAKLPEMIKYKLQVPKL